MVNSSIRIMIYNVNWNSIFRVPRFALVSVYLCKYVAFSVSARTTKLFLLHPPKCLL